ncbi:MAG: lycopene beta-cyclase CrtY [Pirellulaceae bacterium]|nr:lycopene beta-cyclase CrtY [Pirellulaceae bacterium]
MVSKSEFDFVIAGGGLQGSLLAFAISSLQPSARILLIEKQRQFCGNHTWSFHRSDLSDTTWKWFGGLVDKQWDGYHVELGGVTRHIPIGYGSVFSDQLSQKLVALRSTNANLTTLTGSVQRLEDQRLHLETGQQITGTAILDCRGLSHGDQPQPRSGFQKFVGLEVELEEDWIASTPCLMDDRIDQSDGFRFIYTLPISPRRLLVEDTRFSNTRTLDRTACREVIATYLRERGFTRYRVCREESGCLPMPYQRAPRHSQMTVGYRGGFFHPATGYSMPLVANLADRIASSPAADAAAVIAAFREQMRFQTTFSLWLNRLLFQLVTPTRRREIFRRFYGKLPASTIQRFYAFQFTATDAARIFLGRPPMGLTPLRFLQSFREKRCPAFPT